MTAHAKMCELYPASCTPSARLNRDAKFHVDMPSLCTTGFHACPMSNWSRHLTFVGDSIAMQMDSAYRCSGGTSTLLPMFTYQPDVMRHALREENTALIVHIGPWYHLPQNATDPVRVEAELARLRTDVRAMYDQARAARARTIFASHVSTHFSRFESCMDDPRPCSKHRTTGLEAFAHVVQDLRPARGVRTLDFFALSKWWRHPNMTLNHRQKVGDCLHLRYRHDLWRQVFENIDAAVTQMHES